MSKHESPSKQIAIAVIERDGMFVIGKRSAGVPLAGMWEFPGGKANPGETPWEAALREALEETGLVVRYTCSHGVVQHDYPHGRLELHFLGCTPVDPLAKPRPPFRFVARNELAGYEFPPANTELITRLISR